jgi:hypothetical protein
MVHILDVFGNTKWVLGVAFVNVVGGSELIAASSGDGRGECGDGPCHALNGDVGTLVDRRSHRRVGRVTLLQEEVVGLGLIGGLARDEGLRRTGSPFLRQDVHGPGFAILIDMVRSIGKIL